MQEGVLSAPYATTAPHVKITDYKAKLDNVATRTPSIMIDPLLDLQESDRLFRYHIQVCAPLWLLCLLLLCMWLLLLLCCVCCFLCLMLCLLLFVPDAVSAALCA